MQMPATLDCTGFLNASPRWFRRGPNRKRAMKADSKQADLCTYLSAILLGGLLLNALFGWWWADPVAGLVMVPIIAKEGIDGIKGKACCGFAERARVWL
jgi:hypothetical protein